MNTKSEIQNPIFLRKVHDVRQKTRRIPMSGKCFTAANAIAEKRVEILRKVVEERAKGKKYRFRLRKPTQAKNQSTSKK